MSAINKSSAVSVRCLKGDGVKPESSSSLNSELVDGVLIDRRDGQGYKTTTIESQIWMAENLNYEVDNSYCYDNDTINCAKYGRLYTLAAASAACPEGWHLPGGSDWESLLAAVGGASTAGMVLKSSSGWAAGGNGNAFRLYLYYSGNEASLDEMDLFSAISVRCVMDES